jgi:hypothetical protein
MTHRFDFIFTAHHRGDMPITPYAKICLNTSTVDKDGNRFISPDLYSSEYEKYIDELILELQEIKKKLHRKFK